MGHPAFFEFYSTNIMIMIICICICYTKILFNNIIQYGLYM